MIEKDKRPHQPPLGSRQDAAYGEFTQILLPGSDDQPDVAGLLLRLRLATRLLGLLPAHVSLLWPEMKMFTSR